MYMGSLRKEGNYVMTLSDEECRVLEKYARLVECIYHTHIGKVTNAIDMKVMYPFFEVMEKHINIFLSCFKKVSVDESEKIKILSHFGDESKMMINHILS
jgi:hypothetical protein